MYIHEAVSSDLKIEPSKVSWIIEVGFFEKSCDILAAQSFRLKMEILVLFGGGLMKKKMFQEKSCKSSFPFFNKTFFPPKFS